jgi:2-polyprenyl-6-methoxyphenol hydroxylase-like FAD-dependent oxidoreductase
VITGHRAQYLGVFGVEARMLGVEVVPFTQVVDILDNLDRPACITSDGRVFHGDVVLVADGCNSTLRETVFGTTAKETCTGYGIHRSITKVTPAFRNDPLCSHLLDGNVRVWLGDDCHAFFAPLDGGRQMSLSITHKDINKTASFNWKDVKSMNEVHPFVHGWDKTFLAALKYFHTGLHWRLFHHEEMPSWTSANGRVAFLGDASTSHCTPILRLRRHGTANAAYYHQSIRTFPRHSKAQQPP